MVMLLVFATGMGLSAWQLLRDVEKQVGGGRYAKPAAR
jgi:cytochrome oxidase assembly protein ShyY1